MQFMTASDYWRLIHAERARVLTMLEGIGAEAWQAKSLCPDWSTEQVVAHLSAGANTRLLPWILSMATAGFNPGKHNQRRLRGYVGNTPRQTLELYRNSVSHTAAPTKDYAAWLGEVIVHGQDIARPLNLNLTPDPLAVEEVARFYAEKDFAVNSKSLVKGLTLEADDVEFRVGEGPLVRGHLMDLVMAMAGRPAYLDKLEGDGVADLARRLG